MHTHRGSHPFLQLPQASPLHVLFYRLRLPLITYPRFEPVVIEINEGQTERRMSGRKDKRTHTQTQNNYNNPPPTYTWIK